MVKFCSTPEPVMPIRARINDIKAQSLVSLMRMDSLAAEVERSLDVIEARLLTLAAIRKLPRAWKWRPRHHA